MRTFRLPVDQRRETFATTRVYTRTSGAVPRSPRMAMDCPTCGRPNADGKDFCDCGEYLRWDPTGVFAIPAQAAGVAAPATPAASLPAHATSAPPTPVPTEPVLLVLRAPGAAPGDGPPTVTLAVATSGLLQGFVRNQTKRVDSYALRVNGLPEAWVEISPPSVDLLPYGSSGDAHESHFLVTITPPARPELACRPSRLPARGRLARHRRGRGERARRDRDPAVPRASSWRRSRRSAAGRRRVRFTATAATTGNAPLEIELSARDREEKFDLSFSPPLLLLEPNTPTDAQLTATRAGRTGSAARASRRSRSPRTRPASRRRRRRSSPSARRPGSRSGSRR